MVKNARPQRKKTPDPLRPYVLTFALAALCGAFLWGEVDAAPPTLSHLFPSGGQRGATVQTKCTGKIDWPMKVWAPGVDVAIGEEEGQLAVSIPENLAADRVWIRLYNDQGASAAVPFLIGSLAEVEEKEPNNSPSEAQSVAAGGVTINGVLHKRGEVDAFAVDLSAGETLACAVDANTRLGSPMDAILQVVTPDGVVLAENHDDFELDPRLAYTAQESGTHIVRIFAFPSEPNSQIAFSGGDDYIYRLTITTGPFITHAAELAVCRNDQCNVAVRGWNIPPGNRLPVVPFGGGACEDPCNLELEALDEVKTLPGDRLGLVFAQGMAGSARVRVVSHAVLTPMEESGSHESLTLAPPTTVTGCIRAPRESDEYRIPLQEGRQVVITVESQSLHLPLVPDLRLTDPDGKQVAATRESGPARDAKISYTASEDGEHVLAVTDRFGHGGERYAYCLTVREPEPDFALSTESDAIIVKAGSEDPAELKVKIDRRHGPDGSVGPIMIEATGLPPGVSSEAVVSQAEGPTAEEVTLKLSSNGGAFSGPMRIRGTAAEPRLAQRFARTPPKLGANFDHVWLTVLIAAAD